MICDLSIFQSRVFWAKFWGREIERKQFENKTKTQLNKETIVSYPGIASSQ